MSEVWPGAEPWSAPGGPDGVLVIHGFTGSPQGLRGLAEAFAAAGFAVDLPLLSGHATAVEDMMDRRFEDWRAETEASYAALAERCRRVVVAGLSMGGTLAAALCAAHPEIAGLVVVNPAVEPPADSFLEMLEGGLSGGVTTIPAIGSDIAAPGVRELAYGATPVAPLLSMMEGVQALAADLGRIRCPVLVFTSRDDHVVPPSNSDYLAAHVSGPVERVALERSYHVATLDHDAGEIEARAVEFALEVCA
jgi:carboxylesterase